MADVEIDVAAGTDVAVETDVAVDARISADAGDSRFLMKATEQATK